MGRHVTLSSRPDTEWNGLRRKLVLTYIPVKDVVFYTCMFSQYGMADAKGGHAPSGLSMELCSPSRQISLHGLMDIEEFVVHIGLYDY